MSLCAILQLIKGISVITLHQINYVSMGVTFNELESYFSTPYLREESSINDDKDVNFLLDLSQLPMSSFIPLSRRVSKSIPHSKFVCI